MANTKKSKKSLKAKEIEYGSTKKRYIDKSLEDTLKKRGFERKPKTPKVKELPREIIIPKKLVDPDSIKVRLPRNIDSDLEIKPEKKVKKIEVKEPERKLVDLPSHLEFEAPETIEVKTGIKRLTQDLEGAHYGDLPEEIDIVQEETKEEKKKNKVSFFQTIKQTFGFGDDERAEEEENIENKKEELKKEIERKENAKNLEEQRDYMGQSSPYLKEVKEAVETKEIDNQINQNEYEEEKPVQKIQTKQPIEYEEVQKQKFGMHQPSYERPKITKPVEESRIFKKPEAKINDEDESGLEPIIFTDKKRTEESRYDGINSQMDNNNAPEVLDNEEPDEDSSMDIMYSKPKKKSSPFY